MAYSSAVAPGHWNSFGGGTGPNQAANLGRYMSQRLNSGHWRGTGAGGADVYYNPGMQRSYLGPRRNVMPRYGATSGYRPAGYYPAVGGSAGGSLPEQFMMPYQINQMVQSGYEDRERASAGNLQAIGKGYGKRMANSGMNLDRLAQGYEAREAAAGERLNELMKGYQDRYERNMENLENARANELSRIDEDYQKRAATNMQDLVSRGLRNSSVAATSNMGVERARQQSIADVNEAVRKERMAADMNLSGDRLAAQRDALGVQADLSGQTLGFGEQANRTQNDLYGDQLRFQTGANTTQNALAGQRLNFTESTKSDYPGWEDAAQYAQALGAAASQGGYGNYAGGYGPSGGGPGGMTWNPQTRTWQRGGGSYIAGIGSVPLGALGYNVPNMTTMPAANLRPTYWNNSMGRSEASLNNAAMRRGQIEANRQFNANQRLAANQRVGFGGDPNDPNGGMGPSVVQLSQPQGRYLGGGRYSIPGSPNRFTMNHSLAANADNMRNQAAAYRQQGLGAGYVNPQIAANEADRQRLAEIQAQRTGGPNIMRFPGQTPMARPMHPLARNRNIEGDVISPWAIRDRRAQPINSRGVVQGNSPAPLRMAPPQTSYQSMYGLDGTPLFGPGYQWPNQLTPKQIENNAGISTQGYSSRHMAPTGPVRPNTLQDYQNSNRFFGTPMPAWARALGY